VKTNLASNFAAQVAVDWLEPAVEGQLTGPLFNSFVRLPNRRPIDVVASLNLESQLEQQEGPA
jgi:hypothetical protein